MIDSLVWWRTEVRTLNSRHEDFCFCFAADDVVDVGEGEVIAFPDP